MITDICPCLGPPLAEADLEQRRLSKQINKDLKTEKKKVEIKLLLLGTGEAGKSTFVKQMKILHGNGYSVQEKAEFKKEIYQNIIEGIQATITAMQDFNIEFEDDLNEISSEVSSLNPKGHSELSKQVISWLTQLWNDPGIQSCFSRRAEYQVHLCTKSFMDDIERLTEPGYEPSNQDILHARMQTTGIAEHEFMLDTDNNKHKKGGVRFRVIDVGGQRTERRKWIQCFDTVTAVIFLAAISEYDQVLLEDLKTNRVLEAKRLFRSILGMHWFSQCSLILFLNKKDIFEEKIKTVPLNKFFPEFTGSKNDSVAAEEFIKKIFTDCVEDSARSVFSFTTVATNSENITDIFKSVKTIIFRKGMDSIGLT